MGNLQASSTKFSATENIWMSYSNLGLLKQAGKPSALGAELNEISKNTIWI